MDCARLLMLLVFLVEISSEEAVGNFSMKLYFSVLDSLRNTIVSEEERESIPVKLNELHFYVYNSNNRGKETELNPMNPVELIGSQKIFFLLHGWIDSKKTNFWYNDLTNLLLYKYPNASVVQVDWNSRSYQEFALSVHSTESIGSHLAMVINILVTNHRVPVENFVLIGHSLGGQICGWVGKYFEKYTTKKLPRIIALDPAGAIFQNRSDSHRLNKYDAEVVHVIHTSAGYMGFKEACGTIDFYPNGGTEQPGCQNIDFKRPLKLFLDLAWCDHLRSFEYFVEAVRRPGSFKAHRCPNEIALKNHVCSGTEVTMGDMDIKRSGLFYLETNSKSPYSK